jgi:putative endonuclease
VRGAGERKLLGRWGEALVAADLRERGWTIRAAGWQCRFGELDLVAEKAGVLAFVEVKLRQSDRFAAPREFVDRRKQERLRATAELYLSQYPTGLQPRFDVAEVLAPQGMDTRRPTIRYVVNAF